jgi:hypothetical protein
VTPFGWFLVAYWVVSILLNIAYVGRQRTPVTPREAAFIAGINGVFIVLTLRFSTGAPL